MSLDADLMVDRRRLRKQVTVWRILTALAVIAALLSGGVFAARQTGLVVAEAEHVARIRVAGMILPDRQLLETFDRVARSSNAKALLVEIDSPGGSAAASEAIHAAMRRVAERKPVVATIGSLGASGAYITAIGADHIVAQQTSLVGSIGVIVQWADLSDMLARLGIRFDEVKSTPLKATPSPFAPTSEEARARG